MRIPLKITYVGKKRVKASHDNFVYYQPNKHICGDCAVRAITKATGLSWKDAYIKACLATADDMYTFNETKGMTIFLKTMGFEWVPITPKMGEKRPTVSEFAEEHVDGKYILNISNHFVACVGGAYYDIWDCGEKNLYGYWVKRV